MAEHNELGKIGEQKATNFLVKKGFEILKRNYRFKKLELDIIARDKDELVVVEVKTRQSDYLTDPRELVSKSKQKGIIKAANAYIHEEEIDLECRFDLIIAVINSKEERLEHIEGAFYPTL
ncbi:MAG: YraN family protein [Crocinitomicaceae bacterium]